MNPLAQIEDLLSRYRPKGVLIDTNILLLYFLGAIDPARITRFRRTKQFRLEDYDILRTVLSGFKKLVTTPNVLTEVSNLLGELADPGRTCCFDKLRDRISVLEEHYFESRELARTDEFVKMGLTDAAIFRLVRGHYLVLTEDFHLSQYLLSAGADAINFNHIRPFGWK